MSRETETLLNEYASLAAEHGDATESGDYRSANRAADKLATIHEQLASLGEEESIGSLLSHTHPGVRCWAATHVMRLRPREAREVLEALAATKRSLIGMSAQMVLQQHEPDA